MSKLVQAALALCAWIATATVASAQTPTQDAVDVDACLQSGEDGCLVDLILEYAAQGESEADFLVGVLDGQTVMLTLLQRCRPIEHQALSRLQAFLADNEPDGRSITGEQVAARAEFERALNDWLAGPREPWEPTGNPMGVGFDRETSLDEETATIISNLLQIVFVEGSCGDHDRARNAIAQLRQATDRIRDSVSTFEQIMMLVILIHAEERLNGNESIARLTDEITDLIPQIEEPNLGTTIAVLEIVWDQDLDMDHIAPRWNNLLFSAVAAQVALGRREQ